MLLATLDNGSTIHPDGVIRTHGSDYQEGAILVGLGCGFSTLKLLVAHCNSLQCAVEAVIHHPKWGKWTAIEWDGIVYNTAGRALCSECLSLTDKGYGVGMPTDLERSTAVPSLEEINCVRCGTNPEHFTLCDNGLLHDLSDLRICEPATVQWFAKRPE